MRKISIYRNDTDVSKRTEKVFKDKLESAGFDVTDGFTNEEELIVCIGGDGAFLEAVHKYDFPSTPFIGINTGHLGFFQEISPKQMDDFIFNYQQKRYSIQTLTTVKCVAEVGDTRETKMGLNEIVIRSANSQSIHLNISIGGSFIERFSGDGILVATPAGSTAYNYSLGGSIVDPRIKLLQVTPIAPMNTTAYRSFTSSILLPCDLAIEIVPEMENCEGVLIAVDGSEKRYENFKRISVAFAGKTVNLMRFESYDFWSKVKSKFL